METSFLLADIAAHIQGRLDGDAARKISGVASLRSATAADISYLENDRYRKDLEKTAAGAVVMGPDSPAPHGLSVIRVSQPAVSWGRVVELIRPYQRIFSEVSPEAHIGRSCHIARGVGIGPGAWIGDGVRIGEGTEVYPLVTVGDGSTIGEHCRIYPGVHVYHSAVIGSRVILHSGVVIGADGYGFTQEKREDPREPVVHRKIPQVGRVIIEDDVEIGANSTVDRAALDATVVGRGSKIDNLVMIAHNCKVGPHCLLVAQVGLSGSVELGAYVTVAGQAGIAGHVKVAARAIIGAKAGIMKDVKAGEILIGSPALPAGLARRAYAQIENLPEFRKSIADLQKRCEEFQSRLDKLERGSPLDDGE
ncbi:MAG: UDP-3-O-(3-hydroxymyristoyl)glucosamine N-acyltransferase [Planctomycetes bacterium]|nr:UDP-3-O-(3-hydroxymyristoyl)glucosamine N-acyltransferase [Planctomycetota bacterium]